MSISSINPTNGKLIKSYKEDSEKQISGKIEKAHTAWLKWRDTSFSTRADLLKNAAALLLTRKLELAIDG
jgi:succinate-semialdehyde dehydrogenase/glutarate-semialdehyde dehydrogenase